MWIILSTISLTQTWRGVGPRERYRLKDIKQWQTLAYRPCTVGAVVAPTPLSLLSKTNTAMSKLAILHQTAGLWSNWTKISSLHWEPHLHCYPFTSAVGRIGSISIIRSQISAWLWRAGDHETRFSSVCLRSSTLMYLANAQITGNGWSVNAEVFDPIPYGSPIAAASSYSNVSVGDGPAWIEVVSLSATGIEVDTWSGVTSDWLARRRNPSAMANSTNDMKIYGSVAVTALGNAFAVVKQDGQADSIGSWQVADDTVDWNLIGNLNLNGTWGWWSKSVSRGVRVKTFDAKIICKGFWD